MQIFGSQDVVLAQIKSITPIMGFEVQWCKKYAKENLTSHHRKEPMHQYHA